MNADNIQMAVDELIRGGIRTVVPSFDASFVNVARIEGISIQIPLSALPARGPPVNIAIETLAHMVAEAAICMHPRDVGRDLDQVKSTFTWMEDPHPFQLFDIEGSAHFRRTGNRLKCAVSGIVGDAQIRLGVGTATLGRLESLSESDPDE